MQAILFELSTILVVATVGALLARWLRQPMIPAYILVGIILGPVLHLITDVELISVYAEIGIAFLLFIVGLELDVHRLRNIGTVATIGGLIQIGLTFVAGFGLMTYLGLSPLSSSYMGLVAAFSSTFVVIKLLGDKREIDSLHGRIIVGILLLQDIVAVLALSVLEGVDSASFGVILIAGLKGASLFFAAYFFSKHLMPQLFHFAAKSNELLFLTSLAVMFGFSELADLLGYSISVGGFLAGLTLANLPYHIEITGKVKPLRDFFATLFFVSLGLQFVFIDFSRLVWPLLLFVALVAILKPFIILIICSAFGYSSRTSFLAAISMAQVSEFSLILLQMGMENDHLSQSLFSFVVLSTILTIAISSYFIKYDKMIFSSVSKYLKSFERLGRGHHELEYLPKKQYDALLIGCDRGGFPVLKELYQKHNTLVVDYNPEIIRRLAKKHVACMYGDISSPEILEKIEFNRLWIAISTIPEFLVNKELIRIIKKQNKKCMVFVTTFSPQDALELYRCGADYVVLPQLIGGDHIALMLKHRLEKLANLKCLRDEHLMEIKEILSP